MKTRLVDLKPSVDALRNYVPLLKNVKTYEDKGSFNNISFGKLFVKVQLETKSSIEQLDTLEVVQVTHKTSDRDFSILKKNATRCLQNFIQLEEAKGLCSPFIQKYLYQGKKGKIVERAEGDIVDVLNLLPKEKILKLDIKEFIAQMVLAVYALHSRNMVHRDIKLENFLIYFTKDGSLHLKLADLDSVTYAHTNDHIIIGTPSYYAPEIIYKTKRGQEYLVQEWLTTKDKKAIDCYALGITIANIVGWYSQAYCQKKKIASVNVGQFDSLIKNLVEVDPKKRLPITLALTQPCFGETADECYKYLARVIKKFKQPEVYYDSYYQAHADYYPQMNDAFLLLPAHLKEIYHLAASLDDCIKICEDSPNDLVIEAIKNKSFLLMDKIKECEVQKLEAPVAVMKALKRDLTKIKLALKIWESQKKLTPEKLQAMVFSAIRKYEEVNQFSHESRAYFWSLHHEKGLVQANDFYNKIKLCIEEKKSVPFLIEQIYQYYQHGPGQYFKSSFKTILAEKFKEFIRFGLNEWPFVYSQISNLQSVIYR